MDFLNQHVHFIGIGGAGVSGLARIALEAGAGVSGSDMKASPIVDALSALGAAVHIGHAAEHLPADATLVVASAAIKPSNPEHAAASARGLRIVKYAQALGELTRTRTNICVAGTHGKTSTASMLAQILRSRGAGWIVGGEPQSLGSSARWGHGHFVIESCEYDRSFMQLHPRAVVLNNIEADHLDVYGDEDGVELGFTEFVERLPRDGVLIYNADDWRCRRVASGARCERVGFGTREGADWRLSHVDACSGFAQARVWCAGEFVGELNLGVPGRVYALNALAAMAASHWAGASAADALAALAQYRGVRRRFEMLGHFRGAPVIDDYAHHPTAVKQLLESARETFPGRRIVAVFQAHQYGRLTGFFDDFVHALALADKVHVARTYAARESGIVPGEPEGRLCARLASAFVQAESHESFERLAIALDTSTQANDALVFIGAGDINEIAFSLLRPALVGSHA
ncbi:MAG: UDP-N-acetylmuramate--L-alanine ligase [Planctomycetes bacterium]|nr:UDP-N-acetylmuramate--L-alanine ligase [Planctomycetota bacterium]